MRDDALQEKGRLLNIQAGLFSAPLFAFVARFAHCDVNEFSPVGVQ